MLFSNTAFAACPVTYNFVAGNQAIADDVDQNFIDLITCVEALQAIDPIIATEIDTSADLRGIITDESGTGALIFADGAIGAATATTPSANDNDTSVATTAYVQGEINGAGGTDLTCASGVCDVDATVTRDSELSAYTVGTSDPGTAACTEGDMTLDHTANIIYFCVATGSWYGVALQDTP